MKKKIVGIIFIVLGILGALCFEKIIVNRPFSLDRMLLYIYVIVFIGLNIILDIKKLWNFIYKNRYIIGIILFIYVVIMGYNGSSIFTYNSVIEPEYVTKEFVPIWGVNRPIRSDEFLVDTPALLSQYNHNNDFSTYNNALMGRNTNVSMYPKLPTKNLSILTNVRLISFLFMDLDQAYAFYWYLPYFVLFFALFELFMILTKKNKLLSLVGTIMLEFSPSLLWWNATPFLMYGSLATIFFYEIFKSQKKWQKVLFAILLGWTGSSYVMILYPAWMIPYAYLFLTLFIYCIILNKDQIKWTDFLYLIITILTMCGLLIPTLISSKEVLQAMFSTEYPGARSSVGGIGWELYFNYFANIFFPFIDVGNPCEYSQYFSLYPIPIFLGIYYVIKSIKEKKINYLLLLLTVLAILLSIWNFIPIGIFAKLTLLSMSTPDRAQVVVNAICIFILIVIMNEYATEEVPFKRKIASIIVATITCIFGLDCVQKNIPGYMNTITMVISFILFVVLFYFILINKRKGNFIFCIVMIIIGLYQYATIQPINKGLSVLFEKPISKEIQKIEKMDKDGLWITLNAPLHLQSYLLANGVRVINSTNYYPNLELWKKFDSEGKFNEVYNRYAHIMINLTEEETNFYLIQADFFQFNINKNDICKLGANYIATLSILDSQLNNVEKIYEYSNVFIYRLNCN